MLSLWANKDSHRLGNSNMCFSHIFCGLIWWGDVELLNLYTMTHRAAPQILAILGASNTDKPRTSTSQR